MIEQWQNIHIQRKHLGVDGKQETANPLDNNEEREQNRTSCTVIGINRDETIYYESKKQIQGVNHSNQQRTPHIPYL